MVRIGELLPWAVGEEPVEAGGETVDFTSTCTSRCQGAVGRAPEAAEYLGAGGGELGLDGGLLGGWPEPADVAEEETSVPEEEPSGPAVFIQGIAGRLATVF